MYHRLRSSCLLHFPSLLFSLLSRRLLLLFSVRSSLPFLWLPVLYLLTLSQPSVPSALLLLRLFQPFLLPLSLMYRQILAVIVFSPILSVAPIYTERCGYNRSVAAVLNSLMLPFSMVVMTILLMLLKVY